MTWLVIGAVAVLLVVAAMDAILSSKSETAGLTATGSTTAKEASLAAEEEIERTGNEWAPLFAAGELTCKHMTQPACERLTCERPGGRQIERCTPVSPEFRRSFAGAVVQDVAIRGHQAGARFSNGETIEFVEIHVSEAWWIHKVGANAGRKFFE
jgi:hypothetical protein